jgi:transcriptional regulator with XRE-family HTH domain
MRKPRPLTRSEFRLELGRALRARRKALKKTQAQVSQIAGRSDKRLCYIERGHQGVDTADLAHLASVLGTNIVELLQEVLGTPPRAIVDDPLPVIHSIAAHLRGRPKRRPKRKRHAGMS